MKSLIRAAVLCLTFAVHATDGERQGGEKKANGNENDIRNVFLSDIPDYSGNVILARPTGHSITANIMLNKTAKTRIIYGADGKSEQQTDVFELKPGEAREIVLDNLPADAA